MISRSRRGFPYGSASTACLVGKAKGAEGRGRKKEQRGGGGKGGRKKGRKEERERRSSVLVKIIELSTSGERGEHVTGS